MTDSALKMNLDALRRKVRAAQHARSVPLIILGALLVNYGSVSFAPSPVAWRFGAPLAFVAVAVVLKVIESRSGVGATRVADYLVAGGFVFTATNLVLVGFFARVLLVADDTSRLAGMWVIIVALALFGVALAGHDWLLMVASAAIGAVGALIYIARTGGTVFPSPSGEQAWPDVFLAVLGAALVLSGIVAYRLERAAS
jgi:hypothetical protein